jgi:hypothetical protein
MPRQKQNALPADSSQAMARRVQRLAQMVTALEKRSETYFPITRLTIVKGLCATHVAALAFVLFLAQRTRERMHTAKPSTQLALSKPEYLSLADQAVRMITACLKAPTHNNLMRAYQLYATVQRTQNRIIYPMGKYPVRVIHSNELLLIENALLTAALPEAAPDWAYRTARVYAEKYNPRYGTGLIPESLPMVKDIVEFWRKYYALPKPEWQR